MISNELQKLYDNYYQDGIHDKRIISAKDSTKEIVKIIDSLKFNSLLDVGSGDGSVLQELDHQQVANNLSVVEISDSGIDVIKKRNLKSVVSIKKFDGYVIPFENKSFDAALSTYVLEHVEHERIFLKELSRVANYVIISVPLENTLSIKKALKAGKQIGHINFYNLHTFKNILETSDLEVIRIFPYNCSLEYELFCSAKYGRIKYFIRKYSLLILPYFALRVFTYMGIALCKAKS